MINYKASIQAVDYIIQQASLLNTLDKLTILKLLFFAERYSLRKFANSITNDNFVAMKCGPVASATYDIISFKDTAYEKEYSKEILAKDGAYGVKSNLILLLRDDYDELSDNDLESLDFAIANFGLYSPLKLVEITHNYKEWNRYEKELKESNTSFKMLIDDFFEDTTDETKPYEVIPSEHVKLSYELVKNVGLFTDE